MYAALDAQHTDDGDCPPPPTGGLPPIDANGELDAAKELMKHREKAASHQNWVFTAEDKAFMEFKGEVGPAFEQLSIQRLPAAAQTQLAKITGVLSRHSDKSKDAKALMFAAIIPKEVDAGRGKGTKTITDYGDLINDLMLNNALHRRYWKLEMTVTGKTACELADMYNEEGKGKYVLPFYRRPGLDKLKGSLAAFESGVPDPKSLAPIHWRFAMNINSTPGIPMVSAYCEREKKLIVQTPFLYGDKATPVPPIFDVVYPGGVGTDKALQRLREEPLAHLPTETAASLAQHRVVLTAECQKTIALRAVAQVRVMHALDWTHNHITPHSLRLDATTMMVYLMDLTNVSNSSKSLGDRGSSPGGSALGFDYYSLFAVFTTLGMEVAAAFVAKESSDVSDWAQMPEKRVDNTKWYQSHPKWKDEHTVRVR